LNWGNLNLREGIGRRQDQRYAKEHPVFGSLANGLHIPTGFTLSQDITIGLLIASLKWATDDEYDGSLKQLWDFETANLRSFDANLTEEAEWNR
jgi:hypothetical protein